MDDMCNHLRAYSDKGWNRLDIKTQCALMTMHACPPSLAKVEKLRYGKDVGKSYENFVNEFKDNIEPKLNDLFSSFDILVPPSTGRSYAVPIDFANNPRPIASLELDTAQVLAFKKDPKAPIAFKNGTILSSSQNMRVIVATDEGNYLVACKPF